MSWLSFDDLEDRAAVFDAAVLDSPEVDHFCTSAAWLLSAHEAFSPEAEAWIHQEGRSFVVLQRMPLDGGGPIAFPLEAGWGLAAPLVGPDPERGARLLARCALSTPPANLYLTGLRRDGRWWQALVERFSGISPLGIGPECQRSVASLEGGFEGFFSRRSAHFRANLRRARRQAGRLGLTVEYITEASPDDGEALFERALAVEARSWKGLDGVGVDRGVARAFYRRLSRRLALAGRLRVLFLRLEGRDIAYLLGGSFGRTFRGLQLSFDQDYAAHDPGNLAQLALLERLEGQGLDWYDLGTTMAYKARWADEIRETCSLAVFLLQLPESLRT